MSGCVMIMFAAAPADPCAEKHKSCTDSCSIAQGQALRRGIDRGQAEGDYNQCVKACDKTKADCGPKATPKPKKP
ncbi:MAG: hypothetical protein QOJ05_621 [Verrucomicrobiota bacterium]